MISRLVNTERCKEVVSQHPNYFTFDVEEWFNKKENYALIDGENIAFGEYKHPGVYWVHFCFNTARGRDAINLTKRMFAEFCKACPVKIAVGLISVDNLKAKWLIRQVGFQSLGEIMTENGLCEMFYSFSVLEDFDTKEFNNGIV